MARCNDSKVPNCISTINLNNRPSTRGCDSGPNSHTPQPSFSVNSRVVSGVAELVIFDAKLHRLAVVDTAQDREAVHAVGRDVKPQTGAVGKMRIARVRRGAAVAME